MKIFFLIGLVILNPTMFFSQEVTALEAIQVSASTINLKWKSTLAQGDFSLYYYTNAIDDQFKLFDSELISSSNFIGTDVGGIYQYEYSFTPITNGNYFFAVTGTDIRSIDQQAREIINAVVPQNDIILIPEINTSVQPIVITRSQRNRQTTQSIIKHNIAIPLLTSLELQSIEDMFHLRWNVFPKDRSEYVFIIYRSRYPIIQYGTPVGLPEYARVTNQFSFEDRNIGFEIPYYYAIVVEQSTQWDPGINVFSQPAVLLRKSPPFRIKPAIEYIKRQENLSLNIEDFSENEIEQAVQQTLSNLSLIAGTEMQDRSLSDVLAPATINPLVTPSTLATISATPVFLRRQESTIKLDNFDQISQKKGERDEIFTNFLNKIDEKKKDFIQKEYKNVENIINVNQKISENINNLKSLERDLLYSDSLSSAEFSQKLSQYYDIKDQITISRYRAIGMVKNLDKERKAQEEAFLSNQKSLKNKFQQDVQNFEKNLIQQKRTLFLSNKRSSISNIDKQILSLTNVISKNMEFLQQYQANKKLSFLTKDLILQASKADSSKASLSNNIQLQEDQTESMIKVRIARDKQQIMSLLSERKKIAYSNVILENPSDLSVIAKEYNVETIINNNIQEVQSYYKDVSVEQVPNVEDIKNEKWLTAKEEWVYKNRETWNNKQSLWRRRVQEILGEDYSLISSKWMTPSKNVSLQEGRKAFTQKNYKEALYLLSFVPDDPNAMMALGQSFFTLGAYRDAFSIFITAFNMQIPESRYWLDQTSLKILNRDR